MCSVFCGTSFDTLFLDPGKVTQQVTKGYDHAYRPYAVLNWVSGQNAEPIMQRFPEHSGWGHQKSVATAECTVRSVYYVVVNVK